VRATSTAIRQRFLEGIATRIGRLPVQLLVLTHLLEDRPVLVEALHRIAPIAALIGVEYSNRPKVVAELERSHRVLTPRLEELCDPEILETMTVEAIEPDRAVVICEIGGYFAPILRRLQLRLGEKLIGAIEDTEAGHRAYQFSAENEGLPCPVFSLARSPLKRPEDALIGVSCVFSVDRILRDAGMLLDTREALVLGYGKIGRGVALALRNRHCHVSVFDVAPVHRALALAEGFAVPHLARAVQRADLILGTTGTCSLDEPTLASCKPGAVLASCSSKDVEFDTCSLRRNYRVEFHSDSLTTFKRDSGALHLLYDGRPVNFRDGAVVGPFLTLVQGELLVAISEIVERAAETGLHEVSELSRELVATRWLESFCDEESGFLRTASQDSDG
jgi:adenosylhomocysteinase